MTIPPPAERMRVTDFADFDFARRIESTAAADCRAFAEATARLFPSVGAGWIEVAGGIAGYAGPGSPVNGAIGLGFSCEVTQRDVESVERFYRERAEQPVISVCPLAHPTLAAALASGRWAVGAFENVLALELVSGEIVSPAENHIEVRACESAQERELWAIMVANGFSAPDDPTPAELRVGTASTIRPGAQCLLGLIDGEPAGTGELRVTGDIAWLSADTTLPHYRNRGVQGTLQRERLRLARAAGCTVAITESMPGSPSQRNMERLGFRVVYTRVDAVAPAPASSFTPKGSNS
jgi:GNAT superfamily N-acetyltransferase